jgi:hypothetical protein
LPAFYHHIGVSRVKLHSIAAPLQGLGCNQRGTRPHEQIQHDITAFGTVDDGALNNLDRFHRRMQAVGSRFLFLPDGRLGQVAVPFVRLALDMAIENRLVLEFVSRKAKRAAIFDPDDGVAHLKTGTTQ